MRRKQIIAVLLSTVIAISACMPMEGNAAYAAESTTAEAAVSADSAVESDDVNSSDNGKITGEYDTGQAEEESAEGTEATEEMPVQDSTVAPKEEETDGSLNTSGEEDTEIDQDVDNDTVTSGFDGKGMTDNTESDEEIVSSSDKDGMKSVDTEQSADVVIKDEVIPEETEDEILANEEDAKETLKGDVVDSGTCGENATWTLENGVLEIIGTGEMTSSPWKDNYQEDIIKVVIGEGVTCVVYEAFVNCSMITEIQLPDTLNWIGRGAFSYCTSLSKINIPGSVKESDDIYLYWFEGCEKLKTAGPISGDYNIEIGWTDRIPSNAFYNSDYLESIIVPEGITSVGQRAFYGCKSLEYVSFPDSLTQIGNEGYSGGVFNYQCSKLITAGPKGTGCSIEFGNMVSIPDYMFEGCTGLTSITFPETIIRIGKESFRACSGLDEITIPEGIKEIGSWAFYGCTDLEHVIIPASVQAIDETFVGCNKLLTAGPIGGQYDIEFGWTTGIPAGAFEDCSSLERIIIPDGVSSIGSCAFFGCANLEYVLIPESITEVGERNYTAGIFGDDCEKLLTAGYIGTGCNIEFGWTESIPEDAFKSVKTLQSIMIPNTISQIGEGAFIRCKHLENILLPDSIRTIGDEAFSECDNLKKVIIPDVDIAFGTYVFWHCPNLKTAGPAGSGYDIEFGWKESIPDQAFYGCDSLLSMIIPDGVTDIGTEAFRRCENLEYLRIPESVNTIHGYNNSIYTSCYELKTAGPIGGGYNIEFGWTAKIPSHAFYGCDGLRSIILPDGMTEAGYEAFNYCNNLEYVRIPQSLTCWHEYNGTFYNCNKLVTAGPIGGGYNIEFGWTDSLPDYAFDDCQYLESVAIPFGITRIGSHTFDSCTSLTGITIPNSVTEIDWFAFWECSGLENITIPNSVVDLGAVVFGKCSNLKSVRLSNRLTEIKYDCFANCGNLISVEIPLSIVSVGSGAFEDCVSLQDVYYKGTARQWDQIQIKEDNDPLINASIHYLSTESGDSSGVYTFDSWKEEENSVYLDGWPYEVSKYADISFKDHAEELVGNKVFVEFLEHQVYRISELEEHVGIIRDYSVSENKWGPYVSQLSIDNYKYATAADYVIGVYEIDKYVNGSYVFYYTSDARVVYVSPLQYCIGRLDSNVIENNSITINNKSFSLWKHMNAPDENELAEWEGKRIGYYTEETNGQEENTQTVYIITGIAEGASKIVLFSSKPEFEIQVGESMEMVASLRTNGFPDFNWSQPAFVISDESVISISDYTQLSLGGYDFDVYGLAEGKSTLTISDSETGAHVSVTVSVVQNTSTAKNYSYKMDSVPAFYPDYVDDMDKLTNFYDFNGLYVSNYNTEAAANGATRATFDVYNTQYMIGAVDVFDADGTWIKSVPIKKYTDITSVYDTGKTFLALCNNLVNGELLSYTSSYYSEKTTVDITVPAGGYFTISNNFAVSPGVYFYNGIDYLTYCIETICDVVVTSDKNKDKDYQYSTALLSEFFEKMKKDKLSPGSGFSNSMSSGDVMELIIGKMNSFNTKAIGKATTRNLGDAMGVSMDDFKDLLDVIGLDWKGVAKDTLGLGESVFEKLAGPAGFALKGIFSINKISSRVLQTNSIRHSLNRSYISIHSTTITNSATVSGVTVSYGDGAVDDDTVFQVFRIAAPEETYSVEGKDVRPEEYALYNICFVKNEENVQPKGTVTVKIPVPTGMTGNGCTVYRQEENGTWTRIDAAVDGKYLVFETNHFCLFIIKNDYAGICTDEINWKLSDEGVLTIAGKGAIPDYLENNTPWYSYSDQINKVVIGDNITKIGENSFSGITNLTSVELPDSLKEIRRSAFSECNSLIEVLYSGKKEEWQKIKILDGNMSVLYATIKYLASGTSSNEPISCNETKTINIAAGSEYTLKFTPAESSIYYFYSESDTDTYGMIYAINHEVLKSDDDSGQDSNFRIEYFFEAGNTYILAAKFYDETQEGTLEVTVEKKEDSTDISTAIITKIADQIYTGYDITPVPEVTLNGWELKFGTDYELSYSNNVNAGTATILIAGIGNYEGSIKTTFKISPASIDSVIITDPVSMVYTGKSLTQDLAIKHGKKDLEQGTDYNLSYENNTNAGTAAIKIHGIGNYTGTTNKTFMILPGKTTRGDMFNLANNVKVTWKEVPGAKYYKVYREGVTDSKETLKDPVIVTDRLVGWDKQPGLTNGHAYRYRIVASLTGKGDDSGNSPLSYSKLMYRLKTVVIRSVKNTAPGKVTVKYDKSASGDSYVLQYCERQDMVGAKTKVVLGANKTSYVIGGLKKGKTYYISIRVRKKVNGIDYYTTFGVAKKIKITK